MPDSDTNGQAWRVPPGDYLATRPHEFACPAKPFSLYVGMRDGCRLAVDVYLPRDLPEGERLPAIAILTPYYRRCALAPDAPAGVEDSPNAGRYRDFFVPRGYAVVVVDTRGSGASFGSRYAFRAPVERNDHYDIADWIVSQPWSAGRIGATGVSYVGATADFLASTGHPAVKAVVPTFSVWDTYGDHFYPGGVLLAAVASGYQDYMEALDRDLRDKVRGYAYFADPHLQGPAPVDGDNGSLLRAALEEHAANFDMGEFLRRLEFRDSGLSYDPEFTSAAISPCTYADGIRPDVAYYCISGWFDGGGYMNGAINRFLTLARPQHRLLLGPWDHGARGNGSPYRSSAVPEFPLLAETLRFFDRHLKGLDNGLDDEAAVHFFCMADEAWKAAGVWPPPASQLTLHLGSGNRLLREPEPTSGLDRHQVDFSRGTGRQTRFERVYLQPVETYYGDWHGRDGHMLTYTSPPLESDLELSGHAIGSIRLTCSEQDCTLLLYLEDVAPDGPCRYVTEGVLRGLHREVSEAPRNHKVVGPYHSLTKRDAALLEPGRAATFEMALLPTSWLFRRGHSIRLAIAGADRDHFIRIPDGRPPLFEVLRGPEGSRVTLPVIRR